MLRRLLPDEANNRFAGPRAALWLLGAIVAVKAVMGFNAIVIGRTVATAADGVPLDAFSAEAASAVLTLFALWGFGQLILAVQAVLVLVRYRSLVPLIYLFLLVEHVGRRLLFLVHPIAHPSHGPGVAGLAINLALLALISAGLAVSLARPRMKEGDEPQARSN